MTKFILSLLLAVFTSTAAFAQTGGDLNQAENQAVESAQWFKTHFPEAMTASSDNSRLMQHSIEEIPTETAPVQVEA